MNTTTALAIPSKVIPKPTRAEIIEALTIIEIDRRKEKMKEDAKKKEEMRVELNAQLLALHREQEDAVPTINLGHHHNGKAYGADICFSVRNIPPAMHKRLGEYHALRDRVYEPNAHEVRKEVSAMVSGAEPKAARVSKLLGDKDSRAALESMLNVISK